MRVSYRLLVVLLVLPLVACGQRSSFDAYSGSGFAIRTLPDSFLDGSSAKVDIDVQPDGELTRVQVVATDAQNLKALYFTLDYDPTLYSPVSAEASGTLIQQQAASQLVELSVLREPGVVTHGQVIGNWPTAKGFSGDATLATVIFANHALRETAIVPTDPMSAAYLSYYPGTQLLSWRYRSRGDYDQNSLVTIADLTPLGAHLGAVGPFDYSSSLSVVDGDSNGVISITDITPIGASLGHQVTAYNVYSSPTPGADYPASNEGPNGPGATLLGSIAFSAGSGSPTDRRLFNLTLSSPSMSDYFWVRPTDGVSEGTPSTLAAATGTTVAPFASISPSISSGPAPLTVSFNASASSDPDGTIVRYEWDWEGDGTYDLDNGSNPLAEHTYAADGSYLATLRVTDNDGFFDVNNTPIMVGTVSNTPPTPLLIATPSIGTAPLTVNLDASGSSDAEGPIAQYAFDFDGDSVFDLVTGTATVDHTFTTPGTFLVEVQVTDTGGLTASDYENVQVNSPETWHVTLVAPGSDDEGRFNSLAVVGGNPAVSWIDETAHVLYYRSAADPLGSSWNAITTADASGQVGLPITDGEQVSLLEMGGAPGIAYYRDSDLYFVRASDPAGTIWGTPPPLQLVTGSSAQGSHLSMAMIGGQPAIAYYDFNDDLLHYLRSDSGDGTSWLNPPHVIGDGESTSLVELNGKPAVSYANVGDHRVWFSFSPDVNGNDGTWTPSLVSPDVPAGVNGTSLAIVDSFPAIAWEQTFVGLKYSRATDGSYTTWSAPVQPNGTDAASNGFTPSMLVWNGRPAISYAREGAGMLRFVHASDPLGATWDTPQNVDSSAPDTAGLYSHLQLVNNHPAISYFVDGPDDLRFAILY